MVGISYGPVAKLVDRVQGGCSFRFSPRLNTEPKTTQTSTTVTDALLGQISEALSGLDELHLTGCQRVTHEGLVNALRHNKDGIKHLSIENFSPSLVRHRASPFTQ
jgi:hypothetical protein